MLGGTYSVNAKSGLLKNFSSTPSGEFKEKMKDLGYEVTLELDPEKIKKIANQIFQETGVEEFTDPRVIKHFLYGHA
jgi:hypothetical protein